MTAPLSLEYLLSTHANDAIAQGADPKQVSDRLRTYVQRARSDSGLRQQAEDALAQGADPGAVAERFASVVQQPQSEQPGVVSRGLSMMGHGLMQMLTHPLDTMYGAIKAPIESLSNAVAPTPEEAERLNKDPNFQARNIARLGGELHVKGATPKEQVAGAVQTAANIVAPGLFGTVSRAASPYVGSFLGRAAGLLASGAPVGAAYNPDDPGAGAIAGGGTAATVGLLAHGAATGAQKVGNAADLASKIRNAPTPGTTAHDINTSIEDATAKNYGVAQAEGTANGGTSPPVQAALQNPITAKYADIARAGRPTMSDASVVRKAYKFMSKTARAYEKTNEDPLTYDPLKENEAQLIRGAMRELKAATAAPSSVLAQTRTVPAQVAPGRSSTMQGPVQPGLLSGNTQVPGNPTMTQALRDVPASANPMQMQGPAGPGFQLRGQPPQQLTPARTVTTAPAQTLPGLMESFPEAVSEKARMEAERAAFNRTGNAARRIIWGSSVPFEKLLTKSPEALVKQIAEMTPGEAKASLDALYGAGKEGMQFKIAPTKIKSPTLFGAAASLTRPVLTLQRLAPYARLLEEKAGNAQPGPINTAPALGLMGLLTAPRQQP